MTDHIDAPKAELENCPFCDGGTPKSVQLGQEHPAAGQWMVACTNYWCAAQSGYFPTEAEAIAAWNRRPSYAETVAPYVAAQRMVREAIGELFGPLASIESDEAVLRRGPEPKHEAEAQIAALRRVAQEREAVGVAIKPLEWCETIYSPELRGFSHSYSGSIFEENYKAWGDGTWSGPGGFNSRSDGTLETAKAAAQADYEQRICSALVSPPVEAQPAKGVREDAVEAVARFITEELFKSEWNGLRPDRLDPEFKPIYFHERGGMRFQGGQEDMRDFARRILALSTLEPTAPKEGIDDSATAWMREGNGRPIDVTLFHEVAKVWVEEGYSVTPLYASSPAPASGVSEEVVDRGAEALRKMYRGPHAEDEPFHLMARAVLNAADALNLGREG